MTIIPLTAFATTSTKTALVFIRREGVYCSTLPAPSCMLLLLLICLQVFTNFFWRNVRVVRRDIFISENVFGCSAWMALVPSRGVFLLYGRAERRGSRVPVRPKPPPTGKALDSRPRHMRHSRTANNRGVKGSARTRGPCVGGPGGWCLRRPACGAQLRLPF